MGLGRPSGAHSGAHSDPPRRPEAEIQFEWDEHNIAHLAFHDVTPSEAEQIFSCAMADLDHKVTDEDERGWVAVGRTKRGRNLVVVWTVLPNSRYRLYFRMIEES